MQYRNQSGSARDGLAFPAKYLTSKTASYFHEIKRICTKRTGFLPPDRERVNALVNEAYRKTFAVTQRRTLKQNTTLAKQELLS